VNQRCPIKLLRLRLPIRKRIYSMMLWQRAFQRATSYLSMSHPVRERLRLRPSIKAARGESNRQHRILGRFGRRTGHLGVDDRKFSRREGSISNPAAPNRRRLNWELCAASGPRTTIRLQKRHVGRSRRWIRASPVQFIRSISKRYTPPHCGWSAAAFSIELLQLS
jgi:hypothetical protein